MSSNVEMTGETQRKGVPGGGERGTETDRETDRDRETETREKERIHNHVDSLQTSVKFHLRHLGDAEMQRDKWIGYTAL